MRLTCLHFYLLSFPVLRAIGALKLKLSYKNVVAHHLLLNTYIKSALPGNRLNQTLLKWSDDFYQGGSGFHFHAPLLMQQLKELFHWDIISRTIYTATAKVLMAVLPSASNHSPTSTILTAHIFLTAVKGFERQTAAVNQGLPCCR